MTSRPVGGGMRIPKTMSKCVLPEQQQRLLAQQGVGRGRGREAMASTVSTAPGVAPPQAYGTDDPDAPTVPDELIEGFQSGAKHPVSAIMEYSAILKLHTTFEEAPVLQKSIINRFACVCRVNGKPYPQGAGKTKKDAKREASYNALMILLGLAEEEEDGDRCSSYGYETPAAKPNLTVDQEQYEAPTLEKNSVQTLNEMCMRKHWPLEVLISEDRSEMGFECVIRVCERVVARSFGLNKKDSKKDAADEALKVLTKSAHGDGDEEKPTMFDKIGTLAHRVFDRIVSQVPSALVGRQVIATFIVKRGDDDAGRVVAVGTGNMCLKGNQLTQDGRTLFDCHSEVIARRAFLKFIHKELRLVVDGKREESIFVTQQKQFKLKLKEGVTIHLYMSTAPCGDAAVSSSRETKAVSKDEKLLMEENVHYPEFKNKQEGQLRAKLSEGEATMIIGKAGGVQDWDSLMQQGRLLTMSGSDKILKWNVCGLQGALLSCFIEPIYLDSITLGHVFEHGHLARAVCCRLRNRPDMSLPATYRVQHPFLGRLANYVPQRQSEVLSPFSFNWSEGDDRVEIIDCKTGRSDERSPFRTGPTGSSRLSKAAFQHRFRDLAKATNQKHLLEHETYIRIKESAQDYMQAKRMLYSQLENSGLGKWAKKPTKVDMFMK